MNDKLPPLYHIQVNSLGIWKRFTVEPFLTLEQAEGHLISLQEEKKKLFASKREFRIERYDAEPYQIADSKGRVRGIIHLYAYELFMEPWKTMDLKPDME